MIKSKEDIGRAFWACAGFTLLSALISAGFSLQSLHEAGGQVATLYATSRSIALPIAVLYVMINRSRSGCSSVAVVMSIVQLLDGFVGLHLHDIGKTIGPWVLAALNFGLLLWMDRASSRDHKDA